MYSFSGGAGSFWFKGKMNKTFLGDEFAKCAEQMQPIPGFAQQRELMQFESYSHADAIAALPLLPCFPS